jgi:hypothetical protein
MDRSTIIASASIVISLLSFSVSGVTLWLNWFRRGRLAMTKPTVIFFGFDKEPRVTPKVFLRTLLYSTSARGHVVEAMYVKLHRDRTDQIFSFWGYSETNQITPGSGLFVGQSEISCNHHFVLSVQHKGYEFAAGNYFIEVFARVVGKRRPIKLYQISLTVSKGEAGALSGQLGVLYELDWSGEGLSDTRENRGCQNRGHGFGVPALCAVGRAVVNRTHQRFRPFTFHIALLYESAPHTINWR